MKKLLKNSILFTVTTFLIQGLQFVILPLYSNYISSSDYGLIGTFNTTVYLMGILASLNLSAAVGRYYFDCKTDCERAELYSKITKGTFYISTTICLIVLGISWILFTQLNWKGFFAFTIAVFAKYISFYYDIFCNQCIAEQKVKSIAVSTLCSSIVNLTVTFLGVIYCSDKLIGYFLGNLLSSLVGFAFFSYGSRNLIKKVPLVGFRKYISYTCASIPSILSFWIISSCDRYMLIGLRGASEAGIYNMAANFGTVHNMITMSVHKVYTPNTFENLKNGKNLKKQRKLMDTYFLVILWAACGIIVLTSNIVALLNKSYHSCYNVALILTVASLFTGIMQIYNGIISYYLKSLQKKNIVIVVGAGANIILNWILTPASGATGAAIATLVSNIFIALGCMWVSLMSDRVIANPMKEIIISLIYVFIGLMIPFLWMKLVWSCIYTVLIALAIYKLTFIRKERLNHV